MLVDVTRGCEFYGNPTGSGEKGSPPPKSNGYFFMCRGFFGGRGIAHPPSSSHPRCVHQHCRRVLRRRKDWHLSLPPHNVEMFFGEGGIGPPPHCRCVRTYLLAVQIRIARCCRGVRSGTLCDTMRWVCRLFVRRIGTGLPTRDASAMHNGRGLANDFHVGAGR